MKLFWLCIAIAAFDLILGIALVALIEPKPSAYLLIAAGAFALFLAFYWRKSES